MSRASLTVGVEEEDLAHAFVCLHLFEHLGAACLKPGHEPIVASEGESEVVTPRQLRRWRARRKLGGGEKQ